jgi:hypothetical protein
LLNYGSTGEKEIKKVICKHLKKTANKKRSKKRNRFSSKGKPSLKSSQKTASINSEPVTTQKKKSKLEKPEKVYKSARLAS